MKAALKTATGALILLLVVYTFISLWKQSRPVPTVYETITPQVMTIEKKSVSTGTLGPRLKVNLTPSVTGIVDELKVKEGDFVRKGDVVAKLRIIPDVNKLTEADNAMTRAKIRLEQSEREAQRSQALFEKGVCSRDENEKIQNARDIAKQDLDAAISQIEVLTNGFSKNARTVSTNVVRATDDGVVLSIPVKPGESVSGSSLYSQGTTIAVLADMSDIIFEGYIDEMDVVKLSEGMSINLFPVAMPDVMIPAVLEYISNEGVTRSGAKMFNIRAAADIPDTVHVRSGYSVNAEIILSREEDVLTLEESCIVFEGDSQFVFRLLPDSGKEQKWEKVAITTGLSDGRRVAVLSGLSEGDLIRGRQL